MKLRTALKVATAGAVVGTGLYHLIRRVSSARRIHIIGYHRIVDRISDDGPVSPSLCVSTETFRRQMEQVKRHFRVLTLAQAMAAVEGKLALDRDGCAITFDDGYRDVYLRAAPILAELGLPATVFVPSGYVGTGRNLTHDRLHAALWKLGRNRIEAAPADLVDALIARLPGDALVDLADELELRAGGAPLLDADARVLDEVELRGLAERGWEIGAHTINHVVLVHEPESRIHQELLQPKLALESWTGQPCRYFAYCNGYHSTALVEGLQRFGYQGAVTTCDRPNRRGSDRFRLGRKVLWEGHARGLDGKWSESLSAANLHDLFGALGLTRPVDGEVSCAA